MNHGSFRIESWLVEEEDDDSGDCDAIEAVGPWAVDVSGGVELEDGSAKDIEKVRQFIRAAKGSTE